MAKLDTDEPELYENLDAIFLDLRGNLVPFFIEQSQLHKSDLLRLKFEDITTEAAITKLMYLLSKKLPASAFKKCYETSLRGELD